MPTSHEVDYEIIGEGAQMLVVELDRGETVIAEAGTLNFMEEGIEFESKLGDGADPVSYTHLTLPTIAKV